MLILRHGVVIAALLSAWAFSGSDRTPATLAVPAAAVQKREPTQKIKTDKLPALRVLAKTILYIKDNYVDPKRVHPKEMLVAALEAVEKHVPDVLVDSASEPHKVHLNVNDKHKAFDISRVDSLWKMSLTLKRIFHFITGNMRTVEDMNEVEYAAVNGMLQTLDPHSLLLSPEAYREMKLTTKGEFGGLGFMIRMRESVLTIMKVLPNTPAFRAKIKKNDQIVRIQEASTINMDLREAVSMLRGPVDTRVTIHLMRKGWKKPRPKTLTRALIAIESVRSHLLERGIGYVRLINFQGNTMRDLQKALVELQRQASQGGPSKGLNGLILDLRSNPGGLLDQAIQVADAFLSSGTIVATVGLSAKLRNEKRAHADEEDDAFPLVVLVNSGSASASEIVAGALKNQNRAVVMGSRTFGKGSVQVLYDFPDESALKLTIAKYLTPGDKSIQEVGITPDIELIPTMVTQRRVDLFSPRRSRGEADLEHHFSNPSNTKAAARRADVIPDERPMKTLKYLKKSKQKDGAKSDSAPRKAHNAVGTEEEEEEEELDAALEDTVKEDFEIKFARDFLLAAPQLRRDSMLKAGNNFIVARQHVEERRMAEAIHALGVNWTKGATPQKVQLNAVLKPKSPLIAGETAQLELVVTNKGAQPVNRLRAWLEVDNGILDRREFLYGFLKPAAVKRWNIAVKIPKSLLSRTDIVKVKLQNDNGILQESEAGVLNFTQLARPQFAFNWSVNDACAICNRDGLIQRGENVSLFVDITNVGAGKTIDTISSIRNTSGTNIFIKKGRFKLGALAPGETRTAHFRLQVKKAYPKDAFALNLAILDEAFNEFATDKLSIPVVDDAPAVRFVARKNTVVSVAPNTAVFASSHGKRILAQLPKGAVLLEQARSNELSRLTWEKDRFVFVNASAVRRPVQAQKAAPPQAIQRMYARTPAKISLNVDTSQGRRLVEKNQFTLSGTVVDPKLIDVFVLVNDEKLFFKSHEAKDKGQMQFVTQFPLKAGNNVVTVIARQSKDFATHKTVVINHRTPTIAQSRSEKPGAVQRQ